jgi:hypothetical protein
MPFVACAIVAESGWEKWVDGVNFAEHKARRWGYALKLHARRFGDRIIGTP